MAINDDGQGRQGRKKSLFPTSTTALAGANLDFFVSGVNYQITYENFIAGLGVTGTLVQAGDPTGTPVLDTQGTVNNIRNLENGSGVSASVSPQNGITLDHTFIAGNGSGVPVLANETSLTPLIRSLRAGSGISVGVIDDSIQIALSATPASTKTVVINQASDFPTAVGGVITLADDTDYFLTNDISVSDRFVMGLNSQFRGSGTVINALTYTGTGAMITCEDCNFRIMDITLSFPNGPLFSVTSSTGAGIGIIATQNTNLIGHSLGSVSCRIFSILIGGVVLTNDGLTATATSMDVMSSDLTTWIQFAGTGIDLGTTVCESVLFNNSFTTLSSGVVLMDGLANSGNISATGEGLLANVRGTGLGVELGANIDPDDGRWIFESNSRVRNTIRDSLISVQGNAVETVIASEATPVKAAATWVVGRQSGFTGDTTGRATYDLITDVIVPITATLTIAKASGGVARVVACIAENGTVVAQSCIGADCSGSVSGNITLTWQSELSTAGYIEVFLENPTGQGTVNNILVDAVLRVN